MVNYLICMTPFRQEVFFLSWLFLSTHNHPSQPAFGSRARKQSFETPSTITLQERSPSNDLLHNLQQKKTERKRRDEYHCLSVSVQSENIWKQTKEETKSKHTHTNMFRLCEGWVWPYCPLRGGGGGILGAWPFIESPICVTISIGFVCGPA